MAKSKHTVYLSEASFKNLAENLRAYKQDLKDNCQIFCNELAAEGYEVIHAVLAEHRGTDSTGATIGSLIEIEQDSKRDVFKTTVQVTSDAILFLEFGSGLVGVGTADHAAEFDMGSGTYEPKAERQNPAYDNWENPKGWWYTDESGKAKHSVGMPAAMPMYRGGEAMKTKIQEVAMRVFGND